jgi:hypothetical protein
MYVIGLWDCIFEKRVVCSRLLILLERRIGKDFTRLPYNPSSPPAALLTRMAAAMELLEEVVEQEAPAAAADSNKT